MNVDRCKPVFLPVGAGLLERLGDVVAGRGRKALPVAGGGCLTPAARVIVQKLASRYLALILPNAPKRNRISKFFRN